MKKIFVSFILGFFVFLVLTLILTFILTIYFDNNGIMFSSLGKDWYMVYQFTKDINGGFQVMHGTGIYIIGLVGGGFSVILTMITGKLKQYV